VTRNARHLDWQIPDVGDQAIYEKATTPSLLAELKAKAGDSTGALADFEEAVKAQPGSALIYEQIGDLEKARGNIAQARKAYETALRHTQDRATTKRLRGKLR